MNTFISNMKKEDIFICEGLKGTPESTGFETVLILLTTAYISVA